MPPEAVTTAPPEAKATVADRPGRRAAALLWRAARPEARQLWIGLFWLAIAGALDALGPVLGKAFIDRYLLPRDPAIGAIAGRNR